MRQLLLGACALIMLSAPALADEEVSRPDEQPVRCPAVLDVQTNKYDLESAGLFTGRPDSMTTLEDQNGSWNLEDYHPSAHEFYIVCHFEDTLSTLTITIPHDLHLCDRAGNDIVCR